MKTKVLTSISLVFIVSFLFIIKPSNVVGNIQISQLLYNNQSIGENYNYRRYIKYTLSKEKYDFSLLVNYWCGGGAGCYDHGKVIAQVAFTIGDEAFSEYVNTLNNKDKAALINLLSAGIEYGSINNIPSWKVFESIFPISIQRLKERA